VLRPATPNDLTRVQEIVRAAYTHYIARIGREPGPMLDDYAALIDAGQVSVLEHDGAVQGVLVLIPLDDAMLLDNVAIAPAAQGKGLGRVLLDHAEQVARDAGFRTIRLYTNEAMTENLKIYPARGYRETHRVEEKGLKRVYMEKPLA
jgi:GNAT superfamily N-acetyltransferase